MKIKSYFSSVIENTTALDNYLQIIEAASNRPINKKIHYQKHHIIPKSLLKYNPHVIEIINTKPNIIKLTLFEHIMAHYYLYIAVTEPFKTDMQRAIHLIGLKIGLTAELTEDNISTFEKFYAEWIDSLRKINFPKFRTNEQLMAEIDEKEFIKFRTTHTRKETLLQFNLNRGELIRLMTMYNINCSNNKRSQEYFNGLLAKINKEEFCKYRLEYSDNEMQIKFNISYYWLQKLINYFGIKKRKHKYTKFRTTEELCNLISYNELYQYYVILLHTVQDTLIKFDINNNELQRLLKYYNIHKQQSIEYCAAVGKRTSNTNKGKKHSNTDKQKMKLAWGQRKNK